MLIFLSITYLLEMQNSFLAKTDHGMKSRDRRSDLFSGQTSKQYSNIGRHLLFTKCRKTSLDADLLSLLTNAFTDETFGIILQGLRRRYGRCGHAVPIIIGVPDRGAALNLVS